MHNKIACPANDKDCFRCCIKGHFGRVCKKPRLSQPQPLYVQKTVRVAETHGGADPNPMMEIEYQGQTTEVEALFLLSIEGEDLLSWQILQKLSDGVSILGQ